MFGEQIATEDGLWLASHALVVAEGLLGKILVHRNKCVLITETEAYGGSDDEASHAFRGISKRNKSMFEPGGTLYVYLSYGVHKCINVVSGERGQGEAVLIRSGIAWDVTGDAGASDTHAIKGPGRLGAYLGAELSDDGEDLLASDDWGLYEQRTAASFDSSCVERLERIGISKATDLDWRFRIEEVEISAIFKKSFGGFGI